MSHVQLQWHQFGSRPLILPLLVAGRNRLRLAANCGLNGLSNHPSVLGRWKHPGKIFKTPSPRRWRDQIFRHFRHSAWPSVDLFRILWGGGGRAVLPRRWESVQTSLSLRFRFETQDNFSDRRFCPAARSRWGIGGNGKESTKEPCAGRVWHVL